ncbi:hypothetical protein PHO31112_02328 [Pandoraea horticolens]|uniref:HNH endonuclease n=1 Tax=Pandoraea horticolens TaxID=2508298 RepID=A0A5E4UXV9_9BURK|nr:HNH endonuclease signature motif containing protein [Pandoraea horticolens]VVE04852.1 hypothetical protein PHO31112_02328 [Pandoraea horticolens]
MNRLPHPAVDDAWALESLANNDALGSYPHLLMWVDAIAEGYEQYRASGGDALHVVKVPISQEVGDFLKGHYGSPPQDLAHIPLIREQSRHRLCPMCGSMRCGTLDHILPKADFSEFSIFSLNLVPACDCNNKRGRSTTGATPGARILHPYFDDCLSERLISASFEDLGVVPRIGLTILIDTTHPLFRAVEFHVKEIVGKSGILDYLLVRWSSFFEMPEQVVRALGEIPFSIIALRETLRRELEMLDRHHKGRNNWDSVFIHGLMQDDVLDWLFACLTRPGRAQNDPLL